MSASPEQGAAAPHECPVCSVVGLPVMPLRYGLAWAGDGVGDARQAPVPSAPFDPSALPGPGTDKARYTLRLLRGGYLYAYDEARDEWSGHEVDEAGQLYPFAVDDGPLEGGTPAAPAMCSRTAPVSLSRCIQVRDPGKAGRLWLAFTDTRWTPAVLARHADAGHRARHMRCVDVGAWMRAKGTTSQRHAAPLAGVLQRVADYALPQREPAYDDLVQAGRQSRSVGTKTMATIPVAPEPTFDFSPYGFVPRSRADFTGVLWGEHPDDTAPLGVPPLMVALDDPVGATAEVAALMNHRLETFLHERERVRPLAVSSAILQLRDAVEHQAELSAVESMDRSRERMSSYADMRGGPGAGDAATAGLELTAGDLAGIRRDAWRRGGYLAKYDEAGRLAWQNRHEAELAALDEAVISPLANAHVALLESEGLRAHLRCNYDPGDVHSGAGYLGAVLSCIAGTQDKLPASALYREWFEASPRDRDNLLLRAFALNQDRIAAEIAEAAESAGDFKAAKLPWDRLFAVYGEAARQVGGEQLDAFMATLVEQTFAPAANALSKVVDGVPRLYGLVAWGVAAELPLEWVPVEGTSDEIVRSVMLAFQRELGFRRGTSSVRSELRRLQIYGVDPRQRVTTGFVGLNRDGTLATPAGLRARRSNFLEGKLLRWREAMDTSVRTGLGASLLSSLALFQLYRDATTGLRHQRVESWTRFGVAATAAVAAAVEASGVAMENLGNLGSRYAPNLRLGRLVRLGGRVAGAVAGVAMAVLDFRKGRSEAAEGNHAVSAAYYVSAGSGALLALAILAGAVFLAVVSLVLLLLASIFILWREDNARHDWLQHCLWGNLAERYPDMEIEMDEYRAAMGVT